MENITNSNQASGSSNPNFNPQFTGMPTKHSLLSAQADLNTNSFNKNPIPDNLPHTTVPSSTLGGSSSLDSSPVPHKPIEVVLPPIYTAPSQNIGTVPAQKPVQAAPDSSPVFNSPMGQTMNRPMNPPVKPNPTIQAYSPNFVHPIPSSVPVGMSTISNNQPVANHEVVFADSSEEAPVAAPTHARRHLIILIVSTLLIVGLLGGGFYYWYFFMNGKTVLNGLSTEPADTTADQNTIPAKSAPVNSQAPIAANPPKSNQVVPAKTNTPKTNVNASAFAGAETATAQPKKTNTAAPVAFGSAEKEKITAYIADNINRLSPVKSRNLFALTDVEFDGPNRAIVSYSNSEYDISAVANVYLDKSGNVKVTGFSVLEK